MRKEINNRLIGLFVIIAIALGIGFVTLFGIGKYFRAQDRFIMFFNDSLEGLTEGSAVKFRGVKVGEVTQVHVVLNHKNNKLYLPVVIAIEPKTIEEHDIPKHIKKPDIMKELLARGLRAKLQDSNMLTGARIIELDTLPDTPIRLVGTSKKYIEIPTLEAKKSQLNDLITAAGKTLDNINALARSETLKKGIKDFDDLMISGADFMLAGKEALKRGEHLIANFDESIQPVAEDLPDSLRDFTETLSSARVLMDYLARHPESLLTGKGKDNSSR